MRGVYMKKIANFETNNFQRNQMKSVFQRNYIQWILVLCLFSSINLSAEDIKKDSVRISRHSVSFGVGLVPENKQFMDDLFSKGTLGDLFYVLHYNFSDLTTTNALNLSYTFNINKRFSLGCFASFQKDSKNIYENSTSNKKGKAAQYYSCLTPRIYVFWLNKDVFRIYSAVSASFGYNWTEYSFGDTHYAGRDFERKPQLTLAGIRIGRKFYGFGEANLGGRLGYLNMGVGYRFGKSKKY